MFQAPREPHGALQGEHAPLPLGMERRLVGLGLDLAEPVHAAHVVHAVHDATSSGRLGRPVPIMQSRVTSAASRSSLQPSVPAGRSGSTMKRVSAVESHTRISVSAGSVDAEVGEHAARVHDGARAVGRRLVPDRRQAEHLPRVAGAQRADDHVVQLGRVLDRDHVLALAADIAERGDRLGRVRQQRAP